MANLELFEWEVTEEHNGFPLPLDVMFGKDGGLYGESLLCIDAGGELVADPGGGGLFDFFNLAFVALLVPFCCCCACCRHFALLFLNQTFNINKTLNEYQIVMNSEEYLYSRFG